MTAREEFLREAERIEGDAWALRFTAPFQCHSLIRSAAKITTLANRLPPEPQRKDQQ